MSFMFNPHPYDDKTAVNAITLTKNQNASIVQGAKQIAAYLADASLKQSAQGKTPYVIAIDGYAAAETDTLACLIARQLKAEKCSVRTVAMSDIYKESDDIEALLEPNLHVDLEKDPVNLFGKLFEGDFSVLFDTDKLDELTGSLNKANAEQVVIVHGQGAAHRSLRDLCSMIVYLDVIPKDVVLRYRGGKVKNLADNKIRSHKEILRRCYYFDFEIAGRLRADILNNGVEDYYILNNGDGFQMMTADVFNEICAELVKQPFRCKPVYNEGVWGGYYTISQRNLPATMKNCAWVFDLIPLEVSVMVNVDGRLLDIPYFTFVRKEGRSLMGKECVQTFGGYFPIRFNYDDTFHSNGNMSIQVHPGEAYCKQNFHELGRQDESYYIVATGHDAKTYCGLKDDADDASFWNDIHKSEKEHTPIEYKKYVRAEPSCPGKQFLLPAGTIHASGRNQLILEIGSLSVGSYTFKLYDYLRADLDGKPRPIHSYHGKNVLKTERRGDWVKKNLIPEPVVLKETDQWKEVLLGQHDLIYFSLRRLEFSKYAEQDTQGLFHVLVLADGEKVVVESLENPRRSYTMKYLDMVVVPALLGKYRIRNLGTQPVVIHKTLLKDGFQNA